jgi:hypothetical protein
VGHETGERINAAAMNESMTTKEQRPSPQAIAEIRRYAAELRRQSRAQSETMLRHRKTEGDVDVIWNRIFMLFDKPTPELAAALEKDLL